MTMKNSLNVTGLSLSQAQSISNLCNQRAREIQVKLDVVNNFSKSVTIEDKVHVTVTGNILPSNVVDLLTEKASLHACQAFLMENIKAKDTLIKETVRAQADTSMVEMPIRVPQQVAAYIEPVTEKWGEAQLTVEEACTFQEATAFASHIGQFIHAGSKLDKLRKELPTLPAIEWMEIHSGVRSPVSILKHHTSEQLLEVHEELAGLHREHSQAVNYLKAKSKNLTTIENARIAKVNTNAQQEAETLNRIQQELFKVGLQKANGEILTIQSEFEVERQAKIKELAALRIKVNARFQGVVDLFLNKLPQ